MKVEAPIMNIESDHIVLSTKTKGATIGIKDLNDSLASWKIYTEPIPVSDIQTFSVLASRIGFESSEEIKYDLQ